VKIAITADTHLTSRNEHPQRYRALENILDQMVELGSEHLIVAGDLFDASRQNYADLEAVCKNPAYNQIQFQVIPGNHDADLQEAFIAAPNLHIYAQPELVHVRTEEPPFLFVPYRVGITMGEMIGEVIDQGEPFVLIGHGDWMDGLRLVNPLETGVYMPLSRRDIFQFKPLIVFLGHIHASYHKDKVHYPGSPCGLDIRETGRRRFLVYDTGRNLVESRWVKTDFLYYDETLSILPVEDEYEFLRAGFQSRIIGWGLEAEEMAKICLRIKVKGFSTDKSALVEILQDILSGFHLYAEPDISEVSNAYDPARTIIVERFRESMAGFEWKDCSDEPDRDETLWEALAYIYGSSS
jgi:DNA repair protein SbcD/Mre11